MTTRFPARPSQRVKSMAIDYALLAVYLMVLAGVTASVYALFLDGPPTMNEIQGNIVSTLTTVIPAVIAFGILDARGGSPGKRLATLTVHADRSPMISALLRNAVKFLPWQLAHMGVFRGAYRQDFDPVAMALILGSMALFAALLGMALLRADGRHLGDLLARTRVIQRA